jgi:hypothetical protein
MSLLQLAINGRGVEQLGTTWTLRYQPSRKLASESGVHSIKYK